jgi:hypothetical protein
VLIGICGTNCIGAALPAQMREALPGSMARH